MKTTDIWFAAFLRLKGYEITDYNVLSRGKGKFFFDISPSDWKEMKIEFSNSIISGIKLHQIALKDLLY